MGHPLVIVGMLVCTLFYPTLVRAATFADAFSTNPGANWCERWHHVLWDSSAGLMKGVNGDNCCHTGSGPVGCCAEVCGSSCSSIPSCVNAPVFAHFLLTGSNFTGSVRSAEIKFIWSDQQAESVGEHPGLFPVAHPNCHAGFQATVFRKAIAGNSTNNVLRIVRSSDPLTGFPECNGWPTQQSADVNVGTLVTGTVPRYKLKLTTNHDGTTVSTTATLIDTNTSVTLGTVSKTFGKPFWYNNQAKRFGFGGVFGSVCIGGAIPGTACTVAMGQPNPNCQGGTCGQSAAKFYRFDNFVGTYTP